MAQNHSGKKLKSYTVAFKIEVVEWYRGEGMQNVTQTAQTFGLDRKRVREWNGKYDAHLDVNVGDGKKKRKIQFLVSKWIVRSLLFWNRNAVKEGQF